MAGSAQWPDRQWAPGVPHLRRRPDHQCCPRWRNVVFHRAPNLRPTSSASRAMITMRTALSHPFAPAGFQPRPCATVCLRRGFSLIEILVVVALLSVIILGLVAMFHQTQKALLSTTTQVDFLEAGRAAS